MLTRIEQLEKALNGAYTREDSLKLIPEYINIWNSSPLINDWNQVKIKLKGMQLFSRYFNEVIQQALNNPKAPALVELLNEKQLEIKEMGFGFSVLQAIILDTKLCIYRFNNYDELHIRLDMLFDIVKKLTNYNKKYLIEHDNLGFDSDVNYHFDELSKSLDKNLEKYLDNPNKDKLKNKVKEIIQFAKQEMKTVYFANARQLFFSQESLYSQLPKDILGELVSKINEVATAKFTL